MCSTVLRVVLFHEHSEMFGYTDSLAFHPFISMTADSPLLGHGREFGDLLERWMGLEEPWGSGPFGSSLPYYSRQRTPCCSHVCTQHNPQRSHRQHLVVLPSLLTFPSRRDHRDDVRESGEGATGPEQCQGKDASNSREQTASATVGNKDAADTSRRESEGNTSGESPWQFSVDMEGCDEVRAKTEGGMLMVEGRGSSDTSQQMVRYITSLPRHVSHDSLTARLSNGRLTVTQKTAAQLQGQARTLHIDQSQASSQPQPEQQQHSTTKSTSTSQDAAH